MKKAIWALAALLLFLACKRYKDPQPFSDPRIQNKYCNIPSAINYNWGFPGLPEDSICVFPAQVYDGTFLVHDTQTDRDGLPLDPVKDTTFILHFSRIDTTRMLITGYCGNDTLHATANRYLKFVVDSLAGYGQLLCVAGDTLAGHGFKNEMNDSVIHLVFQIMHSAGDTSFHLGTAIRQ